MKVTNYEAVQQKPVEMEGADKCHVRILVGESDGAPNFAMRQFEVEVGGFTPKHQHPYEHEIFVIDGQGIVLEGDHEHPLNKGDVVLVKPDEIHQFRNTGQTPLKFLCLIPNSAAAKNATVVPECGTDPNATS